MQTITSKRRWTDQELMALPRDGRKYELLGGELVVSPTGFQHGFVFPIKELFDIPDFT